MQTILRIDLSDLADTIAARLHAIQSGAAKRGEAVRKKLKGRKLEMGCRAPNCKQRSKGPRFRFLCEKHLSDKPAKTAA